MLSHPVECRVSLHASARVLCSLMTSLLRTLSSVVMKHLLMLTAHKLNLLVCHFPFIYTTVDCNLL